MPQVVMCMLAPDREPDDAYARISDFARYVDLTDTVREVVLSPPEPDGTQMSQWTVTFRNGLLRWTERDTFDPVHWTVEFEQTAGDFATFTGSWRIEPAAPGSRLTFAAYFDLGIPSLAEILDPVAEAALRTNILKIAWGLLGDVEPIDPVELAGLVRDSGR